MFIILGMYNFAAHLNSMASSNKVKMGKTFVKRFLPQQYEKYGFSSFQRRDAKLDSAVALKN